MLRPVAIILVLSLFLSKSYSEHILHSDILVNKMLENNEDLLLLSEELQESELIQEIGFVGKNPELRFEYGRETDVSASNQSSDYPEQDYDLSLRIFPANPWEKKAEKSKIDSFYKLLFLEYTLKEEELIYELYSQMLQLNYKREELKLIHESKQYLKEQITRGKLLLSKGQIRADEFLFLKSKELELQYESSKVDNELYEICYKIEELCAVEVSMESRVVWNNSIFNKNTIPELNPAISQIDKHNKMQRFPLLAEMTQCDIDRFNALKIPWFNHIQFAHSVENDFGEQDNTSLQFAVSLPVFSWYKKEDRIPRRKLHSISRRERVYRKQLLNSIESSYRRLQNAGEQLNEFDEIMTPVILHLEEKIEMNARVQVDGTNVRMGNKLIEIKKLKHKIDKEYQVAQLEYKFNLGLLRCD